MDTCDIQRNLECEYDIPFIVSSELENGEPCYIFGPKNKAKELFTIKVSFRNRVRLYMDFQPEKYSAQFIEAMGRQPQENRKRFAAYTKLLRNRGAKTDVRVNGMPLNVELTDEWPERWKNLHIHITKMPVFEKDEEYAEVVYEWGSIMMGQVLSLADIVPVEEEEMSVDSRGYAEGNLQRIEANRYERNRLNRKVCLSAKGYDCAICGMNFERTYGEIGRHFIHVHHIVPVSQLGSGYIIDPLNDLIPVCPNCHAMLHEKNPPYSPEELRMFLSGQHKQFC